MHDSPTSKIDTLKNLPRSIFVPSFSGPAASTPVSTATFALSQKIDQLSGTSLSNVTISNSTISAASIPDLSSSYLPIAGGTVSGTLSVAGTFTAGGLYSEFAPNQSNPVLSPTGSELLTAFGSVLKVGSTYYYYYMYSPDGTGGYAIGRATSSDGVNWTKDTANNPIFTKAASGWDSSQVGVPNVWVEGSTWYMLYRGWGADGHSRGGLATSPDGITWTRAAVNNCAGTTGNGCVLDLGNVSGGTEDIEFFGIIKVGSTYYASIDNPGGTNRGVGIATSTDLTDWTKNSSNPLFTGGRYCTNIIKLGNYYYAFVSHYVSGSAFNTYGEIEIYRDTTPVFYPTTRVYLGIAVTDSGTNLASDGTNWDAYALDTRWILTDDITRSSFAASNDDLWMYYSGTPTANHANFYTGLAVAGVASSFSKNNSGFFPKAVTTPGQLTVGGGATITGSATTTGNAYFASNVGVGTTTAWGKLSVTNTGTGPSFVVEDSASPDTTPFIIDGAGLVGIGSSTPYAKLSVTGGGTGTGVNFLLANSADTPIFKVLDNGTATLTGGLTASALSAFSGGLTAYASSTIGNGTQASGLTISGGATTTGNAYFAGLVGVGKIAPEYSIDVNGSSAETTSLAATQPLLKLKNTDTTVGNQRAVPGDVMGGSELTNKILGYSERNVARAFEFALRLVQVRNIQDLVRLQMEFIQAQTQAMTEQAKDLTETATKVVMDSAKIPTKGGLSS